MIIMPMEKNIDWAKPPWGTFLLILSCSIIWFLVQTSDQDAFQEGIDYYFTSDLPKLELPAYALTLGDDEENVQRLRKTLDIEFSYLDTRSQDALVHFLMQMQQDQLFTTHLNNNQIITLEHADFSRWKAQRQNYEAILNNSFNKRYAFTPLEHKPVTFLSYQFLHGSTGHLLGNMLFLFLIGCSVEAALGSLIYLVSYLMTGVGAAALFYLANSDSLVPLVGASGAISGVMGMYAVIFGMRKIRMFYWVLFYFDFIKAPALIMLPVWIAYEVFQLLTLSGSHVAYMAHIGGFVTGGLIAFLLSFVCKSTIDTDYLDESVDEESKIQRFQHASNLMGALKMPEAVGLLTELHQEYPGDHEILSRLFKALSFKPDNPQFHQIVVEILSLEDSDSKSLKMIHSAFQHYLQAKGGEIKLSGGILFKLIIRFAKAGYIKDAEYIVQLFLHRKPDTPGLDNALLAVANGWRQQNQQERYDNCMALFRKYFPEKTV